VVSASDSESDVGDHVAQGRDYMRVGDLAFSAVRANFRQNSGDSNVMEMLNPLCYTTHDLTDVNNVVQNVVLDCPRGMACENGLTGDQIIMKPEPSLCENTEVNCDDLQMSGYIATLPEDSHCAHEDVIQDLLECVSWPNHFLTDIALENGLTADKIAVKTESSCGNADVYCDTTLPGNSQYEDSDVPDCVSKSSHFQTTSLLTTGSVFF